MYKVENLRDLFSVISSNYLRATKEPFTEHPLAQLLRHYPEKILRNILNNSDYTIKGSPGMGQWTITPWIAVFNKYETDGAQEGIYLVYLFSDDMQRIYLTFLQGVTRPIETYGRKIAHQKLKSKALDIRTNYERLQDFTYDDNIKLSNFAPGTDYEKSTIFYKKYDTNNLPSNELLISDLQKAVTFYENYLTEANVLTADTNFFEYIGKVEEGKRLLRQHYARERKSKIVDEAKRRRLQSDRELHCDICGFSFFEKYGERGKEFIEAHHIKPIAEMKPGDKTGIDDLALICSNCHRMIHRKLDNIGVEDLKDIILK